MSVDTLKSPHLSSNKFSAGPSASLRTSSCETIYAPSAVRFAHILVATEFSDCSERALTYAVEIAKAYQAHLYILHAQHPDESVRESDYGPTIVGADRWSAEKQLRRLANSQMLAPIQHSQLLKRGRLWEVADRIIHSQEIDLVVVGSRGRGGLAKIFVGSHAEDLCRHASCPVLVVGPNARAPAADFVLRRILFATAYHGGSLHALAYAHSLTEKYQAELILFHAIKVDEFSSVRADDLLEKTRGQLRHLTPECVGFRTTAVAQPCDSPGAAILSVARQQAADLIVLGVRTRSIGLVTHLPWSTAHKVICGANCPVLTVSG